MPRHSKRIERSPERSWVVEDDLSSGFTLSEPDNADDEDSTLRWSGTDAKEQAGNFNLTNSLNRRQPRDTETSEAVHNSSKSSLEPQLVMPSLSVQPPSSTTAPLKRRKIKKPQPAKRSGAMSSRYSDSHSFSPHVLWPILAYSSSILAYVTMILKPFIAVGLAVWIVALLGRYLVNSTVSWAVAPLCQIPGSTTLFPFCRVAEPRGPAEFDELMVVQSNFEDVLSKSAVGVSLPADMKRSESSIRDLRQVVQFSTLASRNELVFEFGGFIDTARHASSDLTRFNSRVGRAVDNVLSTNRWTLQVIDGIAERDAAQGSVGRFLQETVFYPFQSTRVTEDLLFDQYLRHTHIIEEQIADLIMEAQTLLMILQNLDDRLDVIHTITTREGIDVRGSKEELLARLWTKLGGNRASKKKHDDQLRLLQHITVYRKTAWDYVSGTLLKLQSISAGLEDLRERVAAPEVVGRSSEVPLRMHIEHIQLGVERLEAQRTEARKVESEHQRKLLDKGTSGQLSIS